MKGGRTLRVPSNLSLLCGQCFGNAGNNPNVGASGRHGQALGQDHMILYAAKEVVDLGLAHRLDRNKEADEMGESCWASGWSNWVDKGDICTDEDRFTGTMSEATSCLIL